MIFKSPAGLALLAVGLTGCSRQAALSQAPAAEEPMVAVAAVGRASLTGSTVITAEFQPFQEVDVMAKVAGYVRAIKVDLGDRVREGQILAELEVPEMTDEVSRASALVALGGAESAAAGDELSRVRSGHEIAHLSFTRLQEVSQKEPGLIPRQELDEARARDQVAEAQIAAASSRVKAEEQRTQVARAEETRLKTMRNYVTITAPFSGTVTKRYANLGSMIQAGVSSQSQAMPLVRLSQMAVLRLSLPVPESDVPTVKVGQIAEVRVKSLGRTFKGRVARYSGRVDQATRTMITEVDVANPDGVIIPGMYAEVSLQVSRHDNVLTVPLGALERAPAATRVFKVDGAGVLQVVPVQLGLEDSANAEVLSGLNEGDVVVTGRRVNLKAGDRVHTKIVGTTE